MLPLFPEVSFFCSAFFVLSAYYSSKDLFENIFNIFCLYICLCITDNQNLHILKVILTKNGTYIYAVAVSHDLLNFIENFKLN